MLSRNDVEGCSGEGRACSSNADGAECRICHMPAHGLHFGLLTCRACAAFFRRSVAYKLQYSCRLETRTCEVNKNKRFSCRACRYDKCIALGMKKEYVQLNRDKIKNSSRSDLPAVSGTGIITCSPNGTGIVKREEGTYSSGSSLRSDTIREPGSQPPALPEFDYRKEVPLIKETLKMETPYYVCETAAPIYLTNLQRIQLAYRACISERPSPLRKQPGEHVKVERFFLMDFVKQSQEDLKLVARFLTTIDVFRGLKFEEKWTIYKRFWQNFLLLDRFYDTMCTLGFDYHDRHVVLPDGTVVDIYQMRLEDLKSITDYNHEDLYRLSKPHADFVFNHVLGAMRSMKLDEVEFSFIAGYLVWETQELDLPNEVKESGERQKRILADELHLYYSAKFSNYAYRLCQIMHLVHAIQKATNQRKETMTMAKMFDIYKYDVFMAELLD